MKCIFASHSEDLEGRGLVRELHQDTLKLTIEWGNMDSGIFIACVAKFKGMDADKHSTRHINACHDHEHLVKLGQCVCHRRFFRTHARQGIVTDYGSSRVRRDRRGPEDRTLPKMVPKDRDQHEGPVPFSKGCIIIFKI
jgi:hypothetical protein